MTSADGSQVPKQATSGGTVDTTVEDPATSPGFMASGAPISDPGEALKDPYAAEINRLHTFLMQAFPTQMNRPAATKSESPVSVAIRLLSGLTTTAPTARCRAQYCNLPVGHDGDHGFIQYSPR